CTSSPRVASSSAVPPPTSALLGGGLTALAPGGLVLGGGAALVALARTGMRLLAATLDAPGELAILAARSFDMPLSLSASYCFSFLTLARVLGIAAPRARPGGPHVGPCVAG